MNRLNLQETARNSAERKGFEPLTVTACCSDVHRTTGDFRKISRLVPFRESVKVSQNPHLPHASREISREIAARVLSEFGGPSAYDILGCPRIRLRAARQAFALTHPFNWGNPLDHQRVLAAIQTLKAEG